jgi:PadR family transcriptional regulator, regulatory protein PadR
MTEPLGDLEHLLLLAIIRLGPESSAVPIMEELRRHAQRPILPPSVYLALRRLVAKGLVEARLGQPEARRGGRARRHYAPTTTGLKVVRDSQRTLTRLWDSETLTRKTSQRS